MGVVYLQGKKNLNLMLAQGIELTKGPDGNKVIHFTGGQVTPAKFSKLMSPETPTKIKFDFYIEKSGEDRQTLFASSAFELRYERKQKSSMVFIIYFSGEYKSITLNVKEGQWNNLEVLVTKDEAKMVINKQSVKLEMHSSPRNYSNNYRLGGVSKKSGDTEATSRPFKGYMNNFDFKQGR